MKWARYVEWGAIFIAVVYVIFTFGSYYPSVKAVPILQSNYASVDKRVTVIESKLDNIENGVDAILTILGDSYATRRTKAASPLRKGR